MLVLNMEKISSILKEVIEESKPDKKDTEEIKKNLKEFIPKLQKEIRKSKVKAEVFVGGSFARGTMMKSNEYDVDIFLRFPKGSKEISDKTVRNVDYAYGISKDGRCKEKIFYCKWNEEQQAFDELWVESHEEALTAYNPAAKPSVFKKKDRSNGPFRSLSKFLAPKNGK